ncbi:hypothetical protein K493DRAFT_357309 [Basidiobolus meristosporus CBS 931.73]|uniref:Uncharacterized protein n=1 Tax=Basidiobolus meristosporus CBS 931.73 TaxID=1314790 RepID=A0A1Y1XWG5_9FUNG|nr:hypothetical protein K493DRAFT_357309 [Basidiobolus meristosporus CBS 931.73]|eukprot:ORX90062.1 hypothetical protein K493DRAFT_357309 [Basidiobolus meristosporus CBS 931.73]
MATLAYGDHTKFFKPADSSNMAVASVSDHGFSPIRYTDQGVIFPYYMLDEDIEITPEEAQLRRLKIGSMVKRAPHHKYKKVTKKHSKKHHKKTEHKVGEKTDVEPVTEPTTGEVDVDAPVNDEAAEADPDIASDEDNEDDTDPEEAELWGRWGRGRWGRGRWGRGRWGRGRWGRGRWGRELSKVAVNHSSNTYYSKMLFKPSVLCSLLMATLAYGDHAKFFKPADSSSVAVASISDHGFSPIRYTDQGVIFPYYMLDEDIEITPEEAQLRRLKIGSMVKRAPHHKYKKVTKKHSKKHHKKTEHKVGEKTDVEPIIEPTTGEVDVDSPVNDEAAVDDPDIAADEDNEDDTDPEEAELWGRWGRGRWGRGRWGRGRWGRGRWGRGRWGRGRWGRRW